MDKKIAESLEKVADSAAEARGVRVLHFVTRGSDARPVIEITLDGERLITVDDCEEVSKKIQDFADEHLRENVNYRLDVLSPGIDEPIIYNFQLKRSIGHLLRVVQLVDQREVEALGVLRSYTESQLVLEPQTRSKKGQATKSVPPVIIERASVKSIRQVAVIR